MGTGSRQVLKLTGPPKLVQPWQAFQNLFWKSELKAKFHKKWEAYKEEVPKGTEGWLNHFTFKNKMIQQLYNEVSDEIKERVEEQCQVMRKKALNDDDNKLVSFQRLDQTFC